MLRLNKTDKKNKYVEDISEIRLALRNINWDFAPRSVVYEGIRPFDCRKHHWFPATFVPEIPFTLIELLTHPKATVYDPFSGIGTTYFQALSLSRIPFATEICQVAVEFMRSLFILFDCKLDFKQMQGELEKMTSKYDSSIDYIDRIKQDSSIRILVDKLSPWYHKVTFNQLGFLFLAEHLCDDEPTKAAMRISTSAILKRVNSQDRGWGCIADNVMPKKEQLKKGPKNVLRIFLSHLKRLLKDLPDHLANVSKEYYQLYEETSRQETIFHVDTRKDGVIPDDSVDLVVTSPSYPNMTDYVKSQRLSYYWLGVPLSGKTDDLVSEIGARNKRNQKEALECYLKDLQITDKILSRKVKEGGYVCFVMPLFGQINSKRKRVIEEVTLDLGKYFVKEDEFLRSIPPLRRSHNLKWATLEQENILVFRK